MEMPFEKKIVVQLKVNYGENVVPVVDSLLDSKVKPDLVFLELSSIDYPHRTTDVSLELVKYVGQHPNVKFMWDGKNPLENCDEYEIMDKDRFNAI